MTDACDDDQNSEPRPGRKRGLTSLTLGWIAERIRKVDDIKARVESGAYEPANAQVAKAVVTPEEN